jgi:hypothetical protein
MRKVPLAVLMLLAAVGPLRSQTATRSQLSKDSIEISHAKLRLGMTKADVAEKLSEAQFDQKEGYIWILHNGSVIQFENGNLTFAAHVWSNENEDIVDALFGAVSYFNEEGDRACSVVADSSPDPNLSNEKVRITGQRVRISCGDKSIVIYKVTWNGHVVDSVTEALGRKKPNSEDKLQ